MGGYAQKMQTHVPCTINAPTPIYAPAIPVTPDPILTPANTATWAAHDTDDGRMGNYI